MTQESKTEQSALQDTAASQDQFDPQDHSATQMSRNSSWVVSLLFWATLVVAASLYAGVALSPKLAEWMRVRQQYTANAHRLVNLESEIDYLERVIAALKTDPEFARRLASASHSAADSGEIIPVTQALVFGGIPAEAHKQGSISDPAFSRFVTHLAADQRHRRWLLISAGSLILLAFTFLNDSDSSSLRTVFRTARWLVVLPITRYRPSPSPIVSPDYSDLRNEGGVVQHGCSGNSA